MISAFPDTLRRELKVAHNDGGAEMTLPSIECSVIFVAELAE
jgi:hypothetical protein